MSKAPVIQDINDYLNRYVPLFQAMQARLERCDAAGLSLVAPLEPNINDKGTAFAGSLNATATLAGWGTIWLVLREHGIRSHVVIQASTVHYFRPVTGDFTARCKAPSATAIERLVKSVAKKGRGRIELDVTIADASGDAVRFHGRFVAFIDGTPAERRLQSAS